MGDFNQSRSVRSVLELKAIAGCGVGAEPDEASAENTHIAMPTTRGAVW